MHSSHGTRLPNSTACPKARRAVVFGGLARTRGKPLLLPSVSRVQREARAIGVESTLDVDNAHRLMLSSLLGTASSDAR
jgi:hypothetical protein